MTFYAHVRRLQQRNTRNMVNCRWGNTICNINCQAETCLLCVCCRQSREGMPASVVQRPSVPHRRPPHSAGPSSSMPAWSPVYLLRHITALCRYSRLLPGTDSTSCTHNGPMGEHYKLMHALATSQRRPTPINFR
jgi:hypothetical protein